jgi:hypothetical protein
MVEADSIWQREGGGGWKGGSRRESGRRSLETVTTSHSDRPSRFGRERARARVAASHFPPGRLRPPIYCPLLLPLIDSRSRTPSSSGGDDQGFDG